jgi:hypothetical protein
MKPIQPEYKPLNLVRRLAALISQAVAISAPEALDTVRKMQLSHPPPARHFAVD